MILSTLSLKSMNYHSQRKYALYQISRKGRVLSEDNVGDILMLCYSEKELEDVTKKDIINATNRVYYSERNKLDRRRGRKTIRTKDGYAHIFTGELDVSDADEIISTFYTEPDVTSDDVWEELTYE